jgi:host factor-I protein
MAAANNRSMNMSSGRTLSPRQVSTDSDDIRDDGKSGNSKGGGNGGGRQGSLQDAFLNLLRKNKIPVTMFLVKGVKLQGIVTWFDNFSILLRRDGQAQLVYKHAISTIMPVTPIDAEQFSNRTGNRKQRLLQDVFLSRVSDAGVQVTMFLVNGVMLQGRIAAYDLFCMMLERDGAVQLAYKHAVSTIQPATAVDLSDDEDDDIDDVADDADFSGTDY